MVEHMDDTMKSCLQSLFSAHSEVKLAYFFGSRARGEAGPTSDYDIALYIDEDNPAELSRLHLAIIPEITHCLKTDTVDVVLLNTVKQPELAYAIITTGELLYEQEPFRALVEPKILNEYFDFYAILKAHQLTRA